MRIVVCVKHVPDVQSDRRFEDGRLVRGEDDVLNELDENAVEAAVSLVEEHGGEVIALTMGPADAEDALMRALQMGADRGVLVSDDRLEGADALGTALVLSAAITRLHGESPVDLVLTGMASLDAMTSMMPSALACHLHLPFLGLAHELQVEGEGPWTVTISRSADGFDDRLRATTPALVSVTDQVNEPRYPAFAAMKAARSKPMDEWDLDELAEVLHVDDVEDAFTATRVVAADAKVREGAGTVVTDSGDAGKQLAAHLLEEVL
ncbi:electron transfer flavoprotein subunit beta/FixA family protein [Schaalia sp. 19OD2882]|uniref:electron transfer flavoprotein subunit beta/FixA family protein n=1 Tax=Schaalia sp. 19OD2882 TaxID=2794089 RepID=UPI001C1ED53E|nr:electron transfer flavoprotein subunit beta/FixA family protein [Schaalia sp. 19OD2882]QWW20376.1 electron transfer flavoprotein subunit beta/FixA family protein [Schaalia sp. 19OD2882]